MSNQKDKAINDLVLAQETLGELGFTLDSGTNTYYKDYGLSNGTTIRIVPCFNRGLSIDMAYELQSISMHTITTVPIVSGQPIAFNLFPMECISDVTSMLARLAPQSRMPLKESYIVTAECDECKKVVSSFIQHNIYRLCLDCFSEKD